MDIKSVRKSNKIGVIILLVISVSFLICGIIFNIIHEDRLNNWVMQDAIVYEIDKVKETVEDVKENNEEKENKEENK